MDWLNWIDDVFESCVIKSWNEVESQADCSFPTNLLGLQLFPNWVIISFEDSLGHYDYKSNQHASDFKCI